MSKIKNFKKLFTNLFISLRVGRSVEKEFFSDHLARLVKNNVNGIYDAWILTLSQLLSPFYVLLSKQVADLGIREGLVLSKKLLAEKMIAQMRLAHPHVLITAPKGSPVYLQFYPKGLTFIGSLTYDNITSFAKAFSIADTNNPGIVPVPIITELNESRMSFIDVTETLTGAKDTTSTDTTDLDKQLILIQLQASQNLLNLAAMNLGDETAYDKFFDDRIIKSHGKHKAEDGIPMEATVLPLGKMIIASNINEDSYFEVECLGPEPLQFYMAASETDTPQTAITLAAGKKFEFYAENYWDENLKYFMVYNQSSVTENKFKALSFV